MFNIIMFGNFIIKNVNNLYHNMNNIQKPLKDITQNNTLIKY